jgi:hypothetical protein
MSFSRRVLHMDPCPWPAPSKAADAMGYPLPPSRVRRQWHTAVPGDLGTCKGVGETMEHSRVTE